MFELFHIFKGTVISPYIVTSSCILISRNDQVFSFFFFAVLLTVHLSIFISVINQLDAQIFILQ